MATGNTGKQLSMASSFADIIFKPCSKALDDQFTEIDRSRRMKTTVVAPVSIAELNSECIKKVIEKCYSYVLRFTPYTKIGEDLAGSLELSFQQCKDVVEAEKMLKKWKTGASVYSFSGGNKLSDEDLVKTGNITDAQRAERTIVVENLPVHATEKQILQLYPGHTALIACDESGKPEGRAYVEFLTAESALEAVWKNDGKKMSQKQLECSPMTTPSAEMTEKFQQRKDLPPAKLDSLVDLRCTLAKEWSAKDMKKLSDLLMNIEALENSMEEANIPDWISKMNENLKVKLMPCEKSIRDLAVLRVSALRSRFTLIQKRMGVETAQKPKTAAITPTPQANTRTANQSAPQKTSITPTSMARNSPQKTVNDSKSFKPNLNQNFQKPQSLLAAGGYKSSNSPRQAAPQGPSQQSYPSLLNMKTSQYESHDRRDSPTSRPGNERPNVSHQGHGSFNKQQNFQQAEPRPLMTSMRGRGSNSNQFPARNQAPTDRQEYGNERHFNAPNGSQEQQRKRPSENKWDVEPSYKIRKDPNLGQNGNFSQNSPRGGQQDNFHGSGHQSMQSQGAWGGRGGGMDGGSRGSRGGGRGAGRGDQGYRQAPTQSGFGNAQSSFGNRNYQQKQERDQAYW